MAIKIKTKTEQQPKLIVSSNHTPSRLKIPTITGAPVKTPNIIIRAIHIMLMDVRMRIYPKQTKEELEKYSQFADAVYGRR